MSVGWKKVMSGISVHQSESLFTRTGCCFESYVTGSNADTFKSRQDQ